MYDTILEAFA